MPARRIIAVVRRVIPGVLAVVALAGCDVVFGLAEPGTDTAPDGRIDGPDGADAPAPGLCTETGAIVELPLIADTYLRQGLTDPRGGEPVAYVAPGAVTLVRFELGDGVFDELTVTLDQADLSIACTPGGGCGPCPVGGAGQIAVSFVRPDWDEATATHGLRAAGQPWAVAGAGGPDRSAPVAVTSFSGSELMLNLPLGAASASDWPPGLSLLFSVEGNLTTTGMFHTREAPPSCGAPMRPRALARCAGGPLTPRCGDKLVDLDLNEGCDDGNVIDGDGCSATCQPEASVCGNGIVDTGEECDDGNNLSGDGCDNCVATPVPQ